jgi:Porphobilinogen deaminase, C-terminal domain.
MGGGCRVPIAAFAKVQGAGLQLMGRVAYRGNHAVTSRVSGRVKEPERAGRQLARQIRALIRRRTAKPGLENRKAKG